MNTKEAQQNLDALIAEESDVRLKITAAEVELERLRIRLRQLRGSHYGGEVGLARLAVRDSAFPILWEPASKDSFMRTQRIIAVSEKVITTREDGASEDAIQRFSRATGRPPNSKYGRSIDVEKALSIWTAHQSQTEPV